MSIRSRSLAVLALAGALSSACSEDGRTPTAPSAVSPTGNASPSALQVAPPSSRPRGRSYPMWAADWWRWLLEHPATGSPILDPTGDQCGAHQPADAWFLVGSFGADPVVRRCTVPVGRPILLPLINLAYFAFLSDDPGTRTEAFVRGQVSCLGDAQFELVELDGQSVGDPAGFLERSVLFDVHLPADNLFGATADDIPGLLLSPSVDEGYYFFIQPLPPGEHTLRWQASSAACGFGQDITYHLRIH